MSADDPLEPTPDTESQRARSPETEAISWVMQRYMATPKPVREAIKVVTTVAVGVVVLRSDTRAAALALGKRQTGRTLHSFRS